MRPKFVITVNGKDLTSSFAGITSLTLTDKRGFLADTLTLEIMDGKNEIELPEKDAVIAISLGYEGKTLEDKGQYIVDGVGYSIAPDTIRISARSANIKESWNVTKSRSFSDTTIAGILEKVASSQSVVAEVHASLGSIEIEHIDQTNESDGHFLTRLGAQYGALATVKDGRLVFMPLSNGTTTAGSPIPAITIKKSDCSNFDYDNGQRDSEFTSVKARYHDLAEGKTMAVTAGSPGGKMYTLRGTYPSKVEAQAAADAKLRLLSDAGNTCRVDLIKGNPGIITETPAKLEGFKDKIDSTKWICSELQHSLNTSGLQTSLKLVPKATD